MTMPETVNDYYSLCSEFMQFGWSESLHFAPLRPGERLEDSILRHQRLMISKLRLKEGMTVIDVGLRSRRSDAPGRT